MPVSLPGTGFSIDYEGSYVPYYNWIGLSPSGYQIHRHKPNDKIWALFYQKEVFLAGWLAHFSHEGRSGSHARNYWYCSREHSRRG
jgi:hypothetical protein